MVWVPGSDYPSAQQHVGHPVSVLADRTDTGATPLRDNDAVIRWRTGHNCRRRGHQFYPSAEWPSDSGDVPAAVNGWGDITATCGEWVRHVQHAVPELSIYELARHLADTAAKLTEAVTLARRAGLSWLQIGAAAGVSADDAARRWGAAPAGRERPPRREGPAPHPGSGPTR